MKRKSKSWPRAFYDWFNRHWVISGLIITASAYWFVVLRYLGESMKMVVTDKNELTGLGHWVTWPIIFASAMFSFAKSKADNYNETVKTNGQLLLDKMLQSVNAITRRKYRNYEDYINNSKMHSGARPFGVIAQPRSQLEALLEEVAATLSAIFGISRDAIAVSVMGKIDEQPWTWLATVNISNQGLIDQITENPCSTARQIIDRKASVLFFPDKSDGDSSKQYFFNQRDGQTKKVGSILCKDISVPGLRSILSVSTYGMQFCEKGDAEAEEKIQNLLVSTYEIRLQLELALLHIKEHMSPKCMTCDISD